MVVVWGKGLGSGCCVEKVWVVVVVWEKVWVVVVVWKRSGVVVVVWEKVWVVVVVWEKVWVVVVWEKGLGSGCCVGKRSG